MCDILVDVVIREIDLIDCFSPLKLAQGLELLDHTSLSPVDLTDKVKPEQKTTTDNKFSIDEKARLKDLNVITDDDAIMSVINA